MEETQIGHSMERIDELGTGRGFARRAVERAERELEKAKAEYNARCREYQQHFVDLRGGRHCPWHDDQSVECERCRGFTYPT